MFKVNIMSWTIIKINDNGEIKFSNEYAPHDKSIAMKELQSKHGCMGSPVDGFFVIAIVPGNHPVYIHNENSNANI